MPEHSLRDYVEVNSNFKTSVNLYLSLNKIEKVNAFIPTTSSLKILESYLDSIITKQNLASILIGPYGKGKSHLMLVLLALISFQYESKEADPLKELINKIKNTGTIGEAVAEKIETVRYKTKPFLPVVVSSFSNDLTQTFLLSLSDALKRSNLEVFDLETYFSIALERIEEWKQLYPDTYDSFKKIIQEQWSSVSDFIVELKRFSSVALAKFKEVYPLVTAGSQFTPIFNSDVLSVYKNVSEALSENYGYSGLYIVFDEFSKYIESLSETSAGFNMKLLQDLCELSANEENTQLHITFIAHKSIKEYGKYLSSETIHSFEGIEGRLTERLFVTSSKNNYDLIKNAITKTSNLHSIPHQDTLLGKSTQSKYYSLPIFKTNFTEADFTDTVLFGCFPLNPLAAYSLLITSEKVAQNERTLFTFISNNEPNSLANYIANHSSEQSWTVGLDLIYDYFSSLFKSDVTNELIHTQWLNAEYALSKCQESQEKQLIKALAILLIINQEDVPPTRYYLSLSTSVPNFDEVFDRLEEKQIIYRRLSNNNYAFKTKAGTELKSEIKRRRVSHTEVTDVSEALLSIASSYYVIPRKYNAIHCMTRYFRRVFISSSSFLNMEDPEYLLKDYIADGLVIYVYDFLDVPVDRIKNHAKSFARENVVVAFSPKPLDIKKQLIDYEILQDIKEDRLFLATNEIVINELPVIEEDISKEIARKVSDTYVNNEKALIAFTHDGEVFFETIHCLDIVVNNCCDSFYNKSPVINNELINRSFLSSGQTKKARNNIISKLLLGDISEDYYSGSNQEATIFRAVLINTGVFTNSPDDSLREIGEIVHGFLEHSSDEKSSFDPLINTLVSAPFGMRKGVLPILLAFYFSQRKEDMIVYHGEEEISMSADLFSSICDNPEEYAIYLSKEDLEKEKYISSLNELFKVQENRNLSDSRIKNIVICMQRWFRALPQVSRNTTNIDLILNIPTNKTCVAAFRRIMQSVIINPYETLFIRMPKLFNVQSFEESFKAIDEYKTLFDDYFDHYVAFAMNAIKKVFNVKESQSLRHALSEWYEKQSAISKQGLHSNKVTSFMSSLEKAQSYSDVDFTETIAKAVTDIYIEDWNDDIGLSFESSLSSLKQEVESIHVQDNDQLPLSFVNRSGETVTRYYKIADEKSGSVLRNIIEDALDEFDDLSVNDRVSILLEMIEKIIE